MRRLAMRSNVVELLVAVAASTTIALLVVVSGLAIGEATTVSGPATAPAVASTDVRLATAEHDDLSPNAYLCCALIYADLGMSQ